LAALVVEEKARQLAGDAHGAYDEAIAQAGYAAKP